MPLQNQMGMDNNSMAAPNAVGTGDSGVHCVRIRNLCTFTNYSGLRKFFMGFPIPTDGIKIINDNDGNRTGQAYVRFTRAQSVPQAIARGHNQRIGRNVVQMDELPDKLFDEAIDAYRPQRRNNNFRSDVRPRGGDRRDDNNRRPRRRGDYSDSNDENDDDDRNSNKGNSDHGDNDVMCLSDSNDSKDKNEPPFTTVLIEDLPPFTKEQDIMKMFSAYPLVHIILAKRQKMFSSYVRFHNPEDAKAALKNTASHKIGYKTVYLSQLSEQEYETAKREFGGDVDFEVSSPTDGPSYSKYHRNENQFNEIKSPDPSDSHNDIESISSTEQNGNKGPKLFLEGIPGVNVNDPRIQKLVASAPSENSDPRKRAMVQSLQSNPFASGNSPLENNQNVMPMSNGAPNELPVCCVLIENMEYRTTDEEIAEWLTENGNLTPVRIQMLVNNRNQTNGEAFIQFADSEQANQAATLHQARFKSRTVRISLATWQQVQETLNRINEMLLANGFDGISPSNPNYARGDYHRNVARQNNGPRINTRNHHNNDRCVVAITNVPYKANIDDLLDFFDDFDIQPDNIIRRFNDEGKPTGDARVCFKSPGEARRAVDQKDQCRILSRPVFLSLLS